MLKDSATILAVQDIAASRDHYRDVLGFTVSFEYGKPLTYVCLCRDNVSLHLQSGAAFERAPGLSALCIFVKDVDQLHSELVAKGAQITQPPQNYDYGMREFNVVDLDGNRLNFGMSTA